MDAYNFGLEIFLLRTLPKIEKKFQPGKVRLVSQRVGRFKWAPGDIVFRRFDSELGQFEFCTFPKSSESLKSSNLSDLHFGYNKVLVERFLGSDQTQPANPSLVGVKWTFQTRFSNERTVEVVAPEGPPDDWACSAKLVTLQIAQGFKACILNNNRIMSTSGSGETTYLVLSDDLRIQVSSFSPKDIITGLTKISDYDTPPLYTFSLWRPLTYFWVNEIFDLQVVAEQLNSLPELKSEDMLQSEERAIRYLICEMLEARRAIHQYILRLFKELAVELGVVHPTIQRMDLVKDHIRELEDIEKSPMRLGSSMLVRLTALDLKQVLPLFECEFERLYAELGGEFKTLLKYKFDIDAQSPGYIQEAWGPYSDIWSKSAGYALLGLHQMTHPESISISEVHSPLPSTAAMPQSHSKRVYYLKDRNPIPIRGECTKIMFLAMPKIYDSKTFCLAENFVSSNLQKLESILRKSEGYVLKNQLLLCLQYQEKRFNYLLTLIDLARLQELLLKTYDSEDLASEQWIYSQELKFSRADTRWVDIAAKTVYWMGIKQGPELFPTLSVMRFTPECESNEYILPKHLAKDELLTCDTIYQNDHHLAMQYSSRFGMIFLANASTSFIDESFEFQPTALCILLSAYVPGGGGTLLRPAFTHFKLADMPHELTAPWEFPPQYSQCQGFTANTLSLPHSPLRWCTTRLNVYCIWLISPCSYLVFGLCKTKFAILKFRSANRPLSLNQPFVLPANNRVRTGGMSALFWAQIFFDQQTAQYMVSVYKMRLQSC